MELQTTTISPTRSRADAVQEAVDATRSLATALDLLDHAAALRLEIGRSDLRILDALSRQKGSLSAGILAEQVRLSRPALSAALNRLEQRDLISRRTHSADRRSVVVSASASARTQVASLFAPVHDQVEQVLSKLKFPELQLVTAVVKELAAAIQDAAEPNT